MPYGLKRYQQAESLHFITFSCYRLSPFLLDPRAKPIVEEIFERTRAHHSARIYAYVLMPEHVHLFMNEPPAIVVDNFLKVVKQETSKKPKGDRKQFWQIRYHDRNVRGPEEYSNIVQYIHRNPVVRKLVTTPELYPWSSYNHYATGRRGMVEIESEWLASWRKRHVPNQHKPKAPPHPPPDGCIVPTLPKHGLISPSN